MPTATYVSVLVRAHLRDLAPLPKAELMAFKRSVAELGAYGLVASLAGYLLVLRNSVAASAVGSPRASS